jgi:hypothetical protein
MERKETRSITDDRMTIPAVLRSPAGSAPATGGPLRSLDGNIFARFGVMRKIPRTTASRVRVVGFFSRGSGDTVKLGLREK